jgi:hypothetical protein
MSCPRDLQRSRDDGAEWKTAFDVVLREVLGGQECVSLPGPDTLSTFLTGLVEVSML